MADGGLANRPEEPRRDPSAPLAWQAPPPWPLVAAAAAALAFVGLPAVALAIRAGPGRLLQALADPALRQALALTLWTSAVAALAAAAAGIPLAYLLATRRFVGRGLAEAAVQLPLVLPPVVAGLGLLLAFGRRGLLGPALSATGVSVPFTPAAVVMAQAFAGLPFVVQTVRQGIEAIDPSLLAAARTLRAGEAYTLRRIVLPLAFPSALTGLLLAWARALAEFGATITFAGNLPGVTRTLTVAVYVALQSDPDRAVAAALLLLAVSLALLAGVRVLGRRWAG